MAFVREDLVWAPWDGEEQLHAAIVRSVDGAIARVRYVEYWSDGQYAVPVASLLPRKPAAAPAVSLAQRVEMRAPHTTNERHEREQMARLHADDSPALLPEASQPPAKRARRDAPATHPPIKPASRTPIDSFFDDNNDRTPVAAPPVPTAKSPAAKLASALPLHKLPAMMSASAAAATLFVPTSLGSKPNIKVPPLRLMEPLLLPGGQAVPGSINQYLRPYQQQGVKFMHNLIMQKKGGVLGDSMGLGKTIQVVALIAALLGKTGDRARDAIPAFDKKPVGAVLVIAPATLLDNWMREFEIWGYFKASKVSTSKDFAKRMASIEGSEILVTSYDLATTNIHLCCNHDWLVVICDEVHRIKNPATETTMALKKFKGGVSRIGLSGTALQNKFEEMWCLFDWANPGSFGTQAAFMSNIAKPILNGQSQQAEPDAILLKHQCLSQLSALREAYYLARGKDTIKDQLPEKYDRVIFCPMTETQKTAYTNYLASDDCQDILRANESCACGSEKPRKDCCNKYSWRHRSAPCICKSSDKTVGKGAFGKQGSGATKVCKGCHCANPEDQSLTGCLLWREILFVCLQNLAKIANHICQLMPTGGTSKKTANEMRACEQVLEHRPDLFRAIQQEQFLALSDPECSGKMKVLLALMESWKKAGEENKVLIFSLSVRLLTLIETAIKSCGWDYCRLDGGTPTTARQSLVDLFNNDKSKFCFLLSTRAGGEGLNLTSANRVVIFDPSWNPAHDLQAQDRAYRIGQVKNVTVYRLLSEGTVEEHMYNRQVYKQGTSSMGLDGTVTAPIYEGVMGDIDKKGELFGLFNMLTFNEEAYTTLLLARSKRREEYLEKEYGIAVAGDADDAENYADGGVEHVDEDEGYLLGVASLVADVMDAGPAVKRRRRNSAPFGGNDADSDLLGRMGIRHGHEHAALMKESPVEREYGRIVSQSQRSALTNLSPVAALGNSAPPAASPRNPRAAAPPPTFRPEGLTETDMAAVMQARIPPDFWSAAVLDFSAMAAFMGLAKTDFASFLHSQSRSECQKIVDSFYKQREKI